MLFGIGIGGHFFSTISFFLRYLPKGGDEVDLYQTVV